MRDPILLSVEKLPGRSWPIPIGLRGENAVQPVVLDYAAWIDQFGAGAITLVVKRKGDAAAYPVALTTDNGFATWTVSSVDTDIEGQGLAEFIYTVDEQIAKSCVIAFLVGPCIDKPSTTPPDPYETWLETLEGLAAETLQNAQDAADSASDAAGSAEDAADAKDAAEAAQGAAEAAQTDAEGSAGDAEAWAVGKRGGADVPSTDPAYHNNAKYWAEQAEEAAPVKSVNGQTGDVVLDAEDVGALPSDADLDNIPDGTTYKRATGAQLEQIATNAQDIGAIEAKIPSAASAQNQLADKQFVTDSITQGTAIYRGSYASRAALLAVPWQTTDPDAENYVSNNDYAYVLDDETHDDECWRYLYVTGTGWTAQVRINESPLTQAQLDALNSGATAAIINSVADKLDKTGDGSNVTAAFSAASSRANISTGEKLSVIFGKIAKWFSDLKSAAFRDATSSITQGSTDLVESGAVYTGLAGKQDALEQKQINWYGVCDTAAATSEKTVTIPGITALADGLGIRVKFVYQQGYNGTPTLQVNNLPAANIQRSTGTNAVRGEWRVGEVLDLVYDGSAWVIVDGEIATTAYYGNTKLYTGATSASETLALTPNTLNSLADNSIWGYPPYSSSSTYAVGDRVRYNVGVYECITAITTAESWTEAHWQLIPTLQEQINAIDAGKQAKITASGILKGNGSGGVSAATAGTDYTEPFSISVTVNPLTFECVMDKTIAQIDAAVRAGKVLTMTATIAGGLGTAVSTSVVYEEDPNFTYGSLNALAIFNDGTGEKWVCAYSGVTDDGTHNTMQIDTNPFDVPSSPSDIGAQVPVSSTTVSAAGVISYKDANDNVLFSVQLPLYTGGVT